MQWTDEAIILSARKFGESKAVARVFSGKHGVHAGVVRGASSKNNRGILQAGNAVSVTWNARLSEHMGAFKIEPLTQFAAYVMSDQYKLAALSSACALLESALPERHPYPKLYGEFYRFLEMLTPPPYGGRSESNASREGVDSMQHPLPAFGHPPPIVGRENWLETYIKLELEILAQSGFGLDLKTCAATGSTENLMYVSPKSGRAVSAAAGEPYKERLLELPKILRRDSENRERRIQVDPTQSLRDLQDCIAGLKLTGHFLDSRLAAPHGRKLPAARGRLIRVINENSD